MRWLWRAWRLAAATATACECADRVLTASRPRPGHVLSATAADAVISRGVARSHAPWPRAALFRL